jgi:hypothetical protein
MQDKKPLTQDILDLIATGLREKLAKAGAGLSEVPPLGPLAASPVLNTAGPAPATTAPFRTATGAPTNSPSGEPPQTAEPVPPLTPIWTHPPDKVPKERLSSDGLKHVAYEVAPTTDACGDPRWDRVPLPLSPEAEGKIAQYLGVGPMVAMLVLGLQEIAKGGDRSQEEMAVLAHNTLVRAGAPLVPPKDLVVQATAAPQPTIMPADGTPAAAMIVQIQHTSCALVVAKCAARPRVGDLLEQERGDGGEERFSGKIVRVGVKDDGYDLLVASSDVELLRPESCSIRRDVPKAAK